MPGILPMSGGLCRSINHFCTPKLPLLPIRNDFIGYTWICQNKKFTQSWTRNFVLNHSNLLCNQRIAPSLRSHYVKIWQFQQLGCSSKTNVKSRQILVCLFRWSNPGKNDISMLTCLVIHYWLIWRSFKSQQFLLFYIFYCQLVVFIRLSLKLQI